MNPMEAIAKAAEFAMAMIVMDKVRRKRMEQCAGEINAVLQKYGLELTANARIELTPKQS